ncbi:methyltransferase domain-containing protein [Thiotrichales bacterium 19S9-12]|nr:methyltransferase domain-containing protein [Thiotrichales bacterium 19S9-11]MCF6812133.1 methyltransferase domain-containing protein [Thiotrichales bacterium 19S9-12]
MYSACDLNRVKQSFNRAAKSYHTANWIQKNTLDVLIKNLLKLNIKPDYAADFACGCGISTSVLLKNLFPKKLYAIDIADQSLAIAQSKLDAPLIHWIERSYNDCIFPKCFLDLAFSNMGFQWSQDLNQTFHMMYQQLNYQGILAFSIPLVGTLEQLKSSENYGFQSKETVISLLLSNHFEMLSYDELNQSKTYDNALSALKSIKSVGANITKENKNNGLNTINHIKNFFKQSGDYTLNYRIGLFIAKKY